MIESYSNLFDKFVKWNFILGKKVNSSCEFTATIQRPYFFYNKIFSRSIRVYICHADNFCSLDFFLDMFINENSLRKKKTINFYIFIMYTVCFIQCTFKSVHYRISPRFSLSLYSSGTIRTNKIHIALVVYCPSRAHCWVVSIFFVQTTKSTHCIFKIAICPLIWNIWLCFSLSFNTLSGSAQRKFGPWVHSSRGHVSPWTLIRAIRTLYLNYALTTDTACYITIYTCPKVGKVWIGY